MKFIAQILFIVALFMAALTAQASVAVSVGKEIFEQGAKVFTKIIVRGGTEEVTEQAARRTLQVAIKKSPQVAELAREMGEDSLLYVLRSPAARKLVLRHGDDAAEALLRHGKVGEELMEFAPGAAKSIKNLSVEQVRRLVALKRAGKITVDTVCEVAGWASRHPGTALLISAYILSPNVRAAVGALLDAVDTIVSVAAEHPYGTILLAAVLCFLVWLFRAEIKAGILAVFTFPFRLFRKRCAPANSPASGNTESEISK